MTALWEEWGPRLKQTCMKFYVRGCAEAPGTRWPPGDEGPVPSAQHGLGWGVRRAEDASFTLRRVPSRGRDFPTKGFSHTIWVPCSSAQVGPHLPGDSLRRHRFRAQSHKTAPSCPPPTSTASQKSRWLPVLLTDCCRLEGSMTASFCCC